MYRSNLVTPRLTAATAQRLRQLGDVGCDPPGLVASEEVRRRAASRLLLEIDVGERLPVGVADDEASPIQCARKTGLPSDIMSRRRGRNDILPRLVIAQHPQLTTDKSAFLPLDKIALQSTPGWRAIWMECCVHDLAPTPTTQHLVSYAGMSVTRGTKSCAASRANTSAALQLDMALPTARAASSAVVHGGKVRSRAQQLRQLGDVRGDAPRLVARHQPVADRWLIPVLTTSGSRPESQRRSHPDRRVLDSGAP